MIQFFDLIYCDYYISVHNCHVMLTFRQCIADKILAILMVPDVMPGRIVALITSVAITLNFKLKYNADELMFTITKAYDNK